MANRSNASPRAVVLLSVLFSSVNLQANGATIVVEAGCSLVDAIHAANTDAAAGDCPAGSGADVVELTADVGFQTFDNDTDGQNALPSVNSDIRIEGHGHKIYRNLDPQLTLPHFRLVHIGAGGVLALHQVELSGGIANKNTDDVFDPKFSRGGAIFNRGSLTLADSAILSNSAWLDQFESASTSVSEGGGIYNLGDVAITDSTLSGNSAEAFLSSGDAAARGGAIFNGPNALLSIESSTLSGSTARADPGSKGGTPYGPSQGGAIFSDQGSTLTLRDSRIEGNLAESGGGYAEGGGIAAIGASLRVTGTAIVDNLVDVRDIDSIAAASGGGIYCTAAADVEIRASLLENNRARSPTGYVDGTYSLGGAVWSDSPLVIHDSALIGNVAEQPDTTYGFRSGWVAGGAIFSRDSLSVTNSTLSGNSAVASLTPTSFGHSVAGGGLYSSNPDTDLQHLTVANNSVIGFNSHGAGIYGQALLKNSIFYVNVGGDCIGTITDQGGNFGCVSDAPAIIGLGPLADNGGPTPTYSLGPGSNAVDHAGVCGLAWDQRLIAREPPCDSGAFEYNPCLFDDAFENVGSEGTDDTCYGSRLALGTVETRLHCDTDWLDFSASPGRTYEFRTINLLYGADTVLEVAEDCGPILGSNADSGIGASSRLVFGPASGGPLDLRVTEKYNSYSPKEGYGVLVRCIQGCACEPPEGPDLLLADDTIATTLTYEACQTIKLENFIVEPLGDVMLRAGAGVSMQNGSEIRGTLTIEIDPALLPP